MKKIKIYPDGISGQIYPSPSKSQTLRAIVFAMLAKGKSTIFNYLPSPDTFAMINSIQSYDVKVQVYKDKIEIIGLAGKLKPPNDIINAENSGIILRFIGAIAALNNTFSIITGDNSIQKNRVISPLLNGLKQLNVYAESLNKDNRPPIIVKGPIRPNAITIDGQDSQPISALLIACAFSLGPSEITVTNPGEKPWVDLTLSWFDRFDIKYKNEGYTRYTIYGNSAIDAFKVRIDPDFSSISFPIVGALITNSEITINNIDFNKDGGDKKFIDGIQQLGAKIEVNAEANTVKILKGSNLKGTTLDVNDFIDALPILGVLGCFCKGKTTLKNANIARFKESDRIAAITKELKKMGASIEETEDGIEIHESSLSGCVVESHSDHRIAMSLCIAALRAENVTSVNNIECIEKSYPNFLSDLKKLNVKFEVDQ